MRCALLLCLLLVTPLEAAPLYVKAAGGNASAAGTWSATSSAGMDNAGPPGTTTDCVLELGSGQLTLDVDTSCRSLDATSGTGSYTGTLTHTAGVTLSLGDGTAGAGNVAVRLASGMTYTVGSASTSVVKFGTSTVTAQTVTTAGKTLGALTFFSAAATWSITDTLTSGAVTLTDGALTFATNLTLTTPSVTLTAGTVTWDSTRIALSGNGTLWSIGAGVAMATPPSVITITSGTMPATFAGGTRTYGNLTYIGCACATDGLVITGTTTLSTLTLSSVSTVAAYLTLPAGVTTKVSDLVVSGSDGGHLPGIVSSSAGMAATISKSNGVINLDYISLTDSAAVGDTTWCAGTHGVDGGGNSGWTFVACPYVVPSQLTGVGR